MRRNDTSPAAYIADVEGEQRELLDRIRRVIRRVAPRTREGISHGMLDYPGLCNLAAQKHYVAVYTNMRVVARHRASLEGADCGKSCIRYRRLSHLDPGALEKLLRDVKRENAA